MPSIDGLFKRRYCDREIIIPCASHSPVSTQPLGLVEMMAGRGIYLARTTIARAMGARSSMECRQGAAGADQDQAQ